LGLMTIHDIFSADHAKLRKLIQDVQAALAHPEKLEEVFLKLQKETRAHLRKEDEVYYPHVDAGKKISDRELMHTLRNDHAAVVFALESLAIRLRKKVPVSEWKVKFETMINVLLPHFDHEEKVLFPEVERVLPPAELKMLLDKVQALE
jgi:iron-sulfur cluster repair protein YtfE (RIC family)